MIENVFSVAGDVEIGEAVIVVVADGDSHAIVSVSGVGQACLLRHVGETAVFILPVETVPVARIFAVEILRRLHRTGNPSAIHQKNIEQSVVVVVEKRDSAGHGLDQILLRRRRILQNKIQSRGDCSKFEKGRRHRREDQGDAEKAEANQERNTPGGSRQRGISGG